MNINTPANYFRKTGDTTETFVYKGRCVLQALLPENNTAGTITVRDTGVANGAGTVQSITSAAASQQGKTFGPYGVVCPNGITVQLSNAADAVCVVWAPL